MQECQPKVYLGDFINGRFVKPIDEDGVIEDFSPADLSDLLMAVKYRYDHVGEACKAAKDAFVAWARLSFDERKNYLLRLKEIYINRADEIAETIARETGKPMWEAKTEAKAMVGKIDITLNFSMELLAEQVVENALPNITGITHFKPRGVMAVIGPFNFPGHLPNGHIIPALAVGNTIVFKPSEQTPAIGQLMAEMFSEAGFPAGVFNLVQGVGETGQKLVVDDSVDGILFTGSYEVGLKIKQETLHHFDKILALEMGGKNAAIVWEDADLDKAIYECIVGAYITSGQRCSCTSRLLLHKKIAEQFTERFYAIAKKLSVGHWKESVFMGPLINSDALEKYIRFQEIGKRENCESLMRGKALDVGYKGFYVSPSINLVKEFKVDSVFQSTEIFGPNVAILEVDDFDQALHINNSSNYGLVMSLFSKQKSLYDRALVEAKVGLLNWNRATSGASSKLPFGGMGKSGNDRASGHFAVQYCAVPVASLQDHEAFDSSKIMPGINLDV